MPLYLYTNGIILCHSYLYTNGIRLCHLYLYTTKKWPKECIQQSFGNSWIST